MAEEKKELTREEMIDKAMQKYLDDVGPISKFINEGFAKIDAEKKKRREEGCISAFEITFSPTGGTKKAADFVMREFDCDKESISLLGRTDCYGNYTFLKNDICLFAVPSYGGRVPETAVERILKMRGNGARAVLLCVYGNRAYEDTLAELKNTVKEAGFHPVAAIAAVAEHSIMRQFATGRPDAEDQAEITGFAKQIWEKISSGEAMQEVKVPGNDHYKDYGGVPFCPQPKNNCNQCGVCARRCPVGAIDFRNPKNVDKKKCISCMRCIGVCPQHARGINKLKLAVAAKAMGKEFKTRKDNELFVE